MAVEQSDSRVPVEILVCEADFDPAREYQLARERLGGRAGAIASFIGLVRDRAGDETVRTLHLEYYPGMTERSIGAIVEQAIERWPVLDVVVIHRVGSLPPEAQIVFVQVASGHRAAAFAACEFIMDYLKTDAVFWKREDGVERSHWVEATGEDRARINGWEARPAVSGNGDLS